MNFTDFPFEIIFIIFEKLLESEDYDDVSNHDEIEYHKECVNNQGYPEFNYRVYDFDNYNAYQLCALSLLNKNHYNTFNNDIYWKQILQYRKINLSKKNYKKKYIQSIIRPYFKKIDKYYKNLLLEEKTSLKIQEKNIEYIDELFKDSDKNIFGQYIINMNGYWAPTLKNKIPKKSNNWMTMCFETRGYPQKKAYNWEREICFRLKYKCNKNIKYYLDELELSKKRLESCNLCLSASATTTAPAHTATTTTTTHTATTTTTAHTATSTTTCSSTHTSATHNS